jgi:hypothetical protein
MISATCDFSSGWSFVGDSSTDFGFSFVQGADERMYPDNLSFGYTVTVNGDEAESLSWPPSNIVIRELSRNRVFFYRVDAKPDDEVVLSVWASNAGGMITGETEFVIPRPEQPYPSWVWNGEGWEAPVEYPDDGESYIWDEESQSWVAEPEA